MENLGEYHDFHVESDTLLPAAVFENFWNKCIEIQKSRLLTYVDMLLMVEKCIRGRASHAIHRYAKGNNKYMKDYD